MNAGGRILIVHDDAEMAARLSTLLNGGGLEVRSAAGGEPALDAVVAETPDLILADLRPGGLEVCRRLKADSANHDIPIVFVSATATSAERAAAFDLGAADVVPAAIEADELLARLRARIGERRGRTVLRDHAAEPGRAEGFGKRDERYRSLFDNMAQGLAYCRMLFEGGRPRDYIYLDVNGAFEALTGLKNVKGRRVSEIIPGILESDPELVAALGRVALTGQAERFDMYVVALREWFSLAVYCPAKEHFVAVFDVITERKKTEESLRASEERFRRAVVESPFPILIHAEDGAIVQVSNSWCEITGYSCPELATIGDWTELAYGERKPQVQADIDALYDLNERKAEGDYAIRTRSGQTRIWEFSSGPLGRLSDGRRLVISMAMDVTERRAAEKAVQELNAELERRVIARTAELEATNRELESFAHSVSHDLRAPLRGMDGFSQALLEDYEDKLDATGQDYLRRIRGAAQRMGRLIDDLLGLSRVTRAEMTLKPVDLGAMARSVIAELASEQEGRAVTWEVGGSLAARGDPRLVRIVLTNLLGNALKFTGSCERARIEVGERGEGPEHVFFVRDNGAGFDMSYAHRLFGAFQRLHSAQEFPGTGVGLATVQRIVQRHGGRVWAEARPGAGATFYFTLPSPIEERP